MTRGDFWFSTPLRVRYSEIDAQGVVYNAHYLTYFDVGITEYLRTFGYRPDVAAARAVDPQLVKATLEWRAPATLDDDIEVWVRVRRLGRSSLTFALEIHPRGVDSLLCSGEVIWVYADQPTRTAVPVPDAIREALIAREGTGILA